MQSLSISIKFFSSIFISKSFFVSKPRPGPTSIKDLQFVGLTYDAILEQRFSSFKNFVELFWLKWNQKITLYV